MSMEETIRKKLTAALSPIEIEVIDDSESHRGHGGWREGGETHFRVRVVSASFAGMSRVARHRMVNAILKEELNASIHALQLDLQENMQP